jgi:hypothetical protein
MPLLAFLVATSQPLAANAPLIPQPQEIAFVQGNSVRQPIIPFTPKNTPQASLNAPGSELNWKEWLRKTYPEQADILLLLANCESGQNPAKINPNDCGSPSYGLFQYKTKTWNTFCKGDMMSAKDQITCTATMLKNGGQSHWLRCWQRLFSK